MRIRNSLITGLSFGLTSGTITTLGLMVGLHAGTHSKLAVAGGVLTIAIADAFSDALGIHISQEAGGKKKFREDLEGNFCTFFSKFFFALTFLFPVLILPLTQAIFISVVWGMLTLTFMSCFIAAREKAKPFVIIREHLAIAF